MTSQTITIPAREVRPGDVLFGMTVETSKQSTLDTALWRIGAGEDMDIWLTRSQQVTVERPVPSDPIGTVRAEFNEHNYPISLYRKEATTWTCDVSGHRFSDSDVADFPILWKPGMPIPTEGGQA